MKSVKFDFYRVVAPGGHPLQDRLQEIISMDFQDRIRTISNYPVCLDRFSNSSSGRYHGLFVKVRMDGIPPKTNIHTGVRQNISLDDDEGLGEDVAFVLDGELQVLVMQRNRYSVSSSQMARYICDVCELDEGIGVYPILLEGAYQRISELEIFRKLRVKIAPLVNNQIFQNRGNSVDRLIDLSREFESPVIDISFSMGRQRTGGLVSSAVRSAVDNFLAMFNQDHSTVTSIEVVGKETNESESEFIDLIEERMVEEADIELDANRQIDYNGRIQAASNALRRRRQELIRLFQLR